MDNDTKRRGEQCSLKCAQDEALADEEIYDLNVKVIRDAGIELDQAQPQKWLDVEVVVWS